MVTVETLQQVAIFSSVWSTFTTVIILLSRRDTAMGLKKWWYMKTRKSPIKIRYHGPDKNVHEYVLPTKGKGEVMTINDKKLLVMKTADGSTFMLDEEAIRRTDDGVNEISYNYKSIMPIYPHLSEAEAQRDRLEMVERIKKIKEKEEKEAYHGVQMEHLAQYTDPKRLNRLIEYIKLAAKTEALGKATDLEKYVKFGFYAAAAAALIGVLVWYTLDNQIVPQLGQILSAVKNVGSTVLNI